jgi:hypothetical protein
MEQISPNARSTLRIGRSTKGRRDLLFQIESIRQNTNRNRNKGLSDRLDDFHEAGSGVRNP